jgi:hypothetical protein
MPDSVSPKVKYYCSDLVFVYGSASLLSLVSSCIPASLASDPWDDPLDSGLGTKKALLSSEVETTSTESSWSPQGI